MSPIQERYGSHISILSSVVLVLFFVCFAAYDLLTVGHLQIHSQVFLFVLALYAPLTLGTKLIKHIQSSAKRNGVKIMAQIITIETNNDPSWPTFKITATDPANPSNTYVSQTIMGSAVLFKSAFDQMPKDGSVRIPEIPVYVNDKDPSGYYVDTTGFETIDQRVQGLADKA